METTAPAPVEAPVAKTTAKDFFLWAGAILTLYVGITSFLTLAFEYINYAFPDPLAYDSDPFSGAIRFAMASLIVLAPTLAVLMYFIRASIALDAARKDVWVRRWAIMLTLFIAAAVAVGDLIVVLNTFLGGELSIRFGLKAALIFLVASLVFMHFLADLKGYWYEHPRRAQLISIAVSILAIATVVLGFFIIGTPSDARMLRYDSQKVSDLQSIQYEIINRWQQKEALPATLDELESATGYFVVPADPQEGMSYTYRVVGPLSFTLCATFNKATVDTKGRGGYADSTSYSYGAPDQNWKHNVGETCFDRTIDPEVYPPYTKGI